MQTKRILSALIVISISYIGCISQKESKEPITNSFVFLQRYDGIEFCTIYYDLNEIIHRDFTIDSVGKKERLKLIHKERKVTTIEFEKLSKMGNVYIIQENLNFDLEEIEKKYLLDKNVIAFLKIPDGQKGILLKHLWQKGYYVIFKEYQGDYVIVPMEK